MFSGAFLLTGIVKSVYLSKESATAIVISEALVCVVLLLCDVYDEEEHEEAAHEVLESIIISLYCSSESRLLSESMIKKKSKVFGAYSQKQHSKERENERKD